MLSKIIKYLLVWRLAILAIATLATYFLPIKDCCQTFGANLSPSYLANIWANFAGKDFLDLARFGYGLPLSPSTYVFFPLFPIVIRFLTSVIPDYLASGLVLVHVSLVLALFYLYRLIRLDYQDNIARNTLLLIILFPTAFFFGAVYTESFFSTPDRPVFLSRSKKAIFSCLFVWTFCQRDPISRYLSLAGVDLGNLAEGAPFPLLGLAAFTTPWPLGLLETLVFKDGQPPNVSQGYS